MAVSISITIEQGTQNTVNNTTSVKASVVAKWTNGSFNRVSKSGWLKIDGTSYPFTSTFNESETTSGSKTLFSKTVTVTHAADGKKTVSCSASYTSGVSSGTVTATASKTLTTIPRASTLTASNGTLGSALTLTVNRAASSFTHTITYKCGTASGTVATGVGTSTTWGTSNGNTLDLANQNKNGTTVSVTFTVTTYSGSSKVGTSTKTVSMSIPASVVPTVSLKSVIEANSKVPSGFPFVQNHSKLKVYINAAGANGSSPMQITLKVCGVEYSGALSDFANGVTTNIVDCSGTETITMSVVDTRGRRGTNTATVSVLAYEPPEIETLTAERCASDGTLDEQGEYMLVKYKANIVSLNNKNAKAFTLMRRSSDETAYTEEVISATGYTVEGQKIYPADSGSSFDVRLEATDTFNNTAQSVMLQTAFTIMNFKADGKGIGFGKVSELADLVDFDFPVRFGGGVKPLVLESGANFDNYTVEGMQYIGDAGSGGYVNCPVTTGTFEFKVLNGGGDGQIIQRITTCSKTKQNILQRAFYQDAWGKWVHAIPSNKVLWTSGTTVWGLGAEDVIELVEPVSMQASGIVLVFSATNDSGGVGNYSYNYHFVPKTFVELGQGLGSVIMLGTGTPFDVMSSKYVYIFDDKITGNDNNLAIGTAASGIKYNNVKFTLRMVIGV